MAIQRTTRHSHGEILWAMLQELWMSKRCRVVEPATWTEARRPGQTGQSRRASPQQWRLRGHPSGQGLAGGEKHESPEMLTRTSERVSLSGPCSPVAAVEPIRPGADGPSSQCGPVARRRQFRCDALAVSLGTQPVAVR